MRLFFQRVLNVRPETLECRRQTARLYTQKWCTDGAAAATTSAGMSGPVLAFRGEIEAQGRGSLHPHILVWLVCNHLQILSDLASLLKHKPEELQLRMKQFMHISVASFESISHASVQAAPRMLGCLDLGPELGVSKVARDLCKFDGGADLDLLRERPERTPEQQEYLETAAEEDWRRPLVPLEQRDHKDQKGTSIYATPINRLPVAHTPQYRLRSGSILCGEPNPALDATAWREAFCQVIGRVHGVSSVTSMNIPLRCALRLSIAR